MTTTHEFEAQLRVGEDAERELDRFFVRWYDIRPAVRAEQRRGIDRWFTPLTPEHDPLHLAGLEAVEYKADFRASETGNAFIETVSVDTAQKDGWALTSHARVIVYFLPKDDLLYVLPVAGLRDLLPEWKRRYRSVGARNRDYTTFGQLVPLHELEAHFEAVNLADFDEPSA